MRDMQESDGSSPSGITDYRRSVGVAAARVRGKNEGRVQFSDGPLATEISGGHGPMGRHRYGMAAIRVRFSVTPLDDNSDGSQIRFAGPVCYTVRPPRS